MFCLFLGGVIKRLSDGAQVPATSQENFYAFSGVGRRTTQEQREEKGVTDFQQTPVLHKAAVGSFFLHFHICNTGPLKFLAALKICNFNSYLNKIKYLWKKIKCTFNIPQYDKAYFRLFQVVSVIEEISVPNSNWVLLEEVIERM